MNLNFRFPCPQRCHTEKRFMLKHGALLLLYNQIVFISSSNQYLYFYCAVCRRLSRCLSWSISSVLILPKKLQVLDVVSFLLDLPLFLISIFFPYGLPSLMPKFAGAYIIARRCPQPFAQKT